MNMRAEWRRAGKRVILVCGAFDLLHPGHVRLLEQARSLGDILVVGVEGDAAARANAEAGKSRAAALRPVTPAAERAEILAALAAVDFVTEIGDKTPAGFAELLAPDVFVQGGARGPAGTSGAASASASGAQATASEKGTSTVWIPLEPGYSTALLIERIQQLKQ